MVTPGSERVKVTYICSTPEPSTAFALSAVLADDDELRPEGEKGALPRVNAACPEMFEFTGKFSANTAFMGAVEYAAFLVSVLVV